MKNILQASPHLKNVLLSTFVISGDVNFRVIKFVIIALPCYNWCWLPTNHGFENSFFSWWGRKKVKLSSAVVTKVV